MPETRYIAQKHNDCVDFFQIPYNIFDRRFDDIQKELDEYSIGLISRSTFLKGIIPCSISDVPENLSDIKPFKRELQNMANECGCSVADLASVFVYYNDYINSTILGVDSPEELESNIKSIERFDETIIEKKKKKNIRIKDDYLNDHRKYDNF